MKHILLVEDDSLLRHAFKLLLEDQSFRITEAGLAADAIEFAKADIPDVILLDLGLPDASGLEVAYALREHDATKRVPIIALTGRVGSDEKAACMAAGCNGFITKPVEPKVLVQRLTEFLPA